jgi:hypothetical protein
MCQFISFFHRPDNGDVAIFDLTSHSNTQAKLSLNEKLWREGHYLPSGQIVCRVAPDDKITEQECNERLKNHYPSFVEFFNWAMGETCKIGIYSGSLDLSSLTSAAGLKLPNKISGYLDLRSLTSAAGLKLPNEISGSLDLSSLTSAAGLKLPNEISGFLYLRSLTSAAGLKLPTKCGSLDLRSLTSAAGLKLPNEISGFLDLSSLTSAEKEKLTKRRKNK